MSTFIDSDPSSINDNIKNKVKLKDKLHHCSLDIKGTTKILPDQKISATKLISIKSLISKIFKNILLGSKKLNGTWTNGKIYWSIMKYIFDDKNIS